MHNVQLQQAYTCSVNRESSADEHSITGPICIDPEHDIVFFTDSRKPALHAFDVKQQSISYSVDLSSELDAGCNVVGIQHLQLDEAICIAIRSGEILLVNTQTRTFEVVGDFEAGIATMSWAPDQELFTLVSGTGVLFLMTREFDVLHEEPIESTEFGADSPINVGWGKRETQFHGKAGKPSTQAPTPVADVPFDDDCPRVSWRGDGEYFVTSSRSAQPQNDAAGGSAGSTRRVLRVWDRNGSLQSTSEQVGGLEQALTWRPSGNLIASSQRLPHRHDVVFFERNGLRHGEFTLPFGLNEAMVKELAWNSDSTMLAVWIEPLASHVDDASLKTPTVAQSGSKSKIADKCTSPCIQVWTMSNYHWYLKQEHTLPSVSACAWHPEVAGQLYVTTADGHVHALLHGSIVHASGGLHANNHATVAVVDGRKLLLTSFRHQCIPPPMCGGEVDIGAVLGRRCGVRHVAFLPAQSSEDLLLQEYIHFAVLTSTNHLLLLRDKAPACGDVQVLACVAVGTEPASNAPALLRQVVYCSNGAHGDSRVCSLLCLGTHDSVQGTDAIYDLQVTLPPGSTDATVAWSRVHPLPHRAVALAGNNNRHNLRPSSVCAVVSLANGHVHKCVRRPVESTASGAGIAVVPWLTDAVSDTGVDALPPCADVGVIEMPLAADADGALDADDDGVGMVDLSSDEDECADATSAAPCDTLPPTVEAVFVGLSAAGQLFLNGHLLAANCNSFAIHDAFLLFSTHDHVCRFLNIRGSLTSSLEHFRATTTQPPDTDHGMRNVERGSKIITAVPRATRLVFQMPRGNLEIVSPRPTLYIALEACIQQHAYRKAFLLARKHRLNMNLLYDYNPADFEARIDEFLDALDSSSFINLFLSELQDADTSEILKSIAGTDATKQPLAALSTTTGTGFFQGPLPFGGLQHTNSINTTTSLRIGKGAGRFPSVPDKRARVSDLVRKVLVPRDDPKHLLTVVHTYLSRAKPQYQELLAYVRDLRVRNADGQGADTAESALRYANVVVKDADILYNAALGTYDFDLVVMAAQVAQKDPKEYLAFLEELSAFAEPIRKYKIDMHLKRYEHALRNLADARGRAHFDDALKLIQDRGLYDAALNIFGGLGDTEKLNEVRGVCAAYLTKKGKYREAGHMYALAGMHKDALAAFEAGLEHEWVYVMASTCGYDDAQLLVLTNRFIAKLEAGGRPLAAAAVASQYLPMDDPTRVQRCINLKLAGKAWVDAIWFAHANHQSALVSSHIAPVLDAAVQELINRLGGPGGVIALFERHSSRLLFVRQDKLEKRMLEDEFEDGADADLYSDTTSRVSTNRSRTSRGSGSSRSSRGSKNSRMTHRSRRRHEAKKTSLREGGSFEEVALLDALNEIVKNVDVLTKELPLLCDALVHVHLTHKAQRATALLGELRDMINSRYASIWSLRSLLTTALPPEDFVPTEQDPHGGHFSPGNDAASEKATVDACITGVRLVKVQDVDLNVPGRPVAPTDADDVWKTQLLFSSATRAASDSASAQCLSTPKTSEA
eukprot:m.1002163 g.1002163  ORF g.1002163 m.1002163 type:complete len:1524 (+) comp24034_c0_seq14:173-4744(+)